jgi:hypothetical protein
MYFQWIARINQWIESIENPNLGIELPFPEQGFVELVAYFWQFAFEWKEPSIQRN